MGKPAVTITLKLVWENVGKRLCTNHLAWKCCHHALLVLWKTLIEKMDEFAGKTSSEKQFNHSCVTREVSNPLPNPECLGALVPILQGREMDKIKSKSVKAFWEMLGMLLIL